MTEQYLPQLTAAATLAVLAFITLCSTLHLPERLRDHVTGRLVHGRVETRRQRCALVTLHLIAFPRRTAQLPVQLRRARQARLS